MPSASFAPAAIAFGFVVCISTVLGSAMPAAATAYLAAGATGSCSASSPCSSMNSALNVSGGRVICLNRGNYGGAVLNTAVNIACGDGLWETDVSVIINTQQNTLVYIEGLSIDYGGFNGAQFAINGSGSVALRNVRSGNGGTGLTISSNLSASMFVHISNSVFYDNESAGIKFISNGSNQLVVTDSFFIRNGSGTAGAGILVKPGSTGNARVQLIRVSLENNVFGLAVDGSGSTAGINATVSDSVATSNSQDGIIATSSGAPIGILVQNTRATNNTIGIRSLGGNVTVRVQGSQIIGNGTGLSSGGALLTGGGNTVEANGTNGSFTGSYPLQ